MKIESIRLKNYRNYKDVNINFSGKKNILLGDNGQGKTNILEAIFLCATGRSHRTARDIELVKHEEDGFFICLNINVNRLSRKIEIAYKNSEKKRIKINEIPIKKIGELIGNINVVLFSPEDLLVIKEGPGGRRRFVDITLSQLKPSYFHELQQYIKILAQRNTLLKDIEKSKHFEDTLEVWNKSLASTGSRIIRYRNEYIEKLSLKSKKYHMMLSENSEELDIKYAPNIEINKDMTISEIEERFINKINEKKRIEIIKGMTLVGPQRDDIEVLLNGDNLKAYGSQGQQRTAVLSMKLSEIEIIKEDSGEMPILLLDDVMSELDEKRMSKLIENVGEVQTFITTTRDIVDELVDDNEILYYYVDKGNIENINLRK